MLLIFLVLLAAGSWYFALSTPPKVYFRDWRLKSFDLTAKEEQDFHLSVRKVMALTGAIFFSVLAVLALVSELWGRPLIRY